MTKYIVGVVTVAFALVNSDGVRNSRQETEADPVIFRDLIAVNCPTCGGTGWDVGDPLRKDDQSPCTTCGQTGKVFGKKTKKAVGHDVTISGRVIVKVGDHWEYADSPVEYHTHTCTKCGYEFDHDEDGGWHKCPKCGGRPAWDGGWVGNYGKVKK